MALVMKAVDKNGTVIREESGKKEVNLMVEKVYEEGDRIVLEVDQKDAFYVISVDDALGEELVYLTGKEFSYEIPFGKKKVCYSPKIFSGEKHLATARTATEEERKGYRNLARNKVDQHGDTHCYPHASANVETRGEAVFAAKNAIDGITANTSHGEWPFGSWGINQREDAVWKLEFGRPVVIDKLCIYLRADFPHDNWWQQVTLRFSDGTLLDWRLEKTAEGQEISIEKKEVEWLQLESLIKADDPSPFPALTQLQVYGIEK